MLAQMHKPIVYHHLRFVLKLKLAFNTLNNLSRDGVLNPSEVREWHTKIEQATSETSLNGYIKTLNSIEEGEAIIR